MRFALDQLATQCLTAQSSARYRQKIRGGTNGKASSGIRRRGFHRIKSVEEPARRRLPRRNLRLSSPPRERIESRVAEAVEVRWRDRAHAGGYSRFQTGPARRPSRGWHLACGCTRA